MKSHSTPVGEVALLNTLATCVGLTAALVAVKLLLDPNQRHTGKAELSTEQKVRMMQQAAVDPLYLADMHEVGDDFAYVDAENV